MRIVTSLSCIALAAMLSACGMPDQGYYDANGNYIAPANTTNEAQRNRAPDPGKHPHRHPRDDRYYRGNESDRLVVTPSGTTYSYDRAGYYDANGYYVNVDDNMSVPRDMFPPRGMCRVWLPNRAPANQPRIEACEGIQYRAPSGSYVVYGG